MFNDLDKKVRKKLHSLTTVPKFPLLSNDFVVISKLIKRHTFDFPVNQVDIQFSLRITIFTIARTRVHVHFPILILNELP